MSKKRLIAVGLMFMSGCAAPSVTTSGSASLAVAQQLASTKLALADQNRLSLAPSMPPPLQGIGYAVVSVQPGRNTAHKRVLAIRVARMEAMRALAEQIHGVQIDGRTTIAEAVLQSDTLRATVSGAIRGAHTIRIEPHSADIYEVVLEIDPAVIAQLLRLAGRKEQEVTEDVAQEREQEATADAVQEREQEPPDNRDVVIDCEIHGEPISDTNPSNNCS